MIMLDLNVLMDVLQKREPHYRVSAAVLERILHGQERGALSAHAVTTVHYLVGRYVDRVAADRAISWLLHHLTVCAVGREELERARSLGWPDFALIQQQLSEPTIFDGQNLYEPARMARKGLSYYSVGR